MEMIFLALSRKMEEGYGGFFFGNWASSGKKISKILVLWENLTSDIVHLEIPLTKGL